MQPVKTVLTNVFQHEYLEYDFKTGITGVIGRNGSGKSTFLDGLFFSVTGQTGHDCNKSDLLR